MGEGGGGEGTVCPPPHVSLTHPSSHSSFPLLLSLFLCVFLHMLLHIHLLLTGGQCEHSQSSLHSCTSSLPRLIDIKLSLKQITEIFH